MTDKYWEKTEYTKLARVTAEDLEYIKSVKGKGSVAGYLRELIKKDREKLK